VLSQLVMHSPPGRSAAGVLQLSATLPTFKHTVRFELGLVRRLPLWVSNLDYTACTLNAAERKAGYPAYSVSRPPRHPSPTALAGFGLPLHNLSSTFAAIVCLGTVDYLLPPPPFPPNLTHLDARRVTGGQQVGLLGVERQRVHCLAHAVGIQSQYGPYDLLAAHQVVHVHAAVRCGDRGGRETAEGSLVMAALLLQPRTAGKPRLRLDATVEPSREKWGLPPPPCVIVHTVSAWGWLKSL
jgi:hypothetical protein